MIYFEDENLIQLERDVLSVAIWANPVAIWAKSLWMNYTVLL